MRSYFLLKLGLLTSVVLGIETYTVKAALQECKNTAAARMSDAVGNIWSTQSDAPKSSEKNSTDRKWVLDQGLRKRFWDKEKGVRRERANVTPLG